MGLKKTKGSTSVLNCKGFRYSQDYAFAVLDNDGANLTAIIGRKQEFPMSELMLLKGHDIELAYVGEHETSSGKYDRVRIECIY